MSDERRVFFCDPSEEGEPPCAGLAALRAELDECRVYCLEGDTPVQCIQRLRALLRRWVAQDDHTRYFDSHDATLVADTRAAIGEEK